MYSYNSAIKKTTWYYSSCEKETDATTGAVKRTFYISGLDGLCAIYVINNGTPTLYYVHTDHLGSIMALRNATTGTIDSDKRYSYDAWGRRRNPSNYSYTGFSVGLTNRGFTGHEHLDNVNLINMNGRMYDPLLGRMLSPDNNVQLPDFSQNLNRYSYALNNPLVYTDPDGEFLFLLLGAYIGASVAAGTGGFSGADFTPFGGAQGSWKGSDWLKGFVVGAIAGAQVDATLANKFNSLSTLTKTPGWSKLTSAIKAANVSMLETGLNNGFKFNVDDMWEAGLGSLMSSAINTKVHNKLLNLFLNDNIRDNMDFAAGNDALELHFGVFDYDFDKDNGGYKWAWERGRLSPGQIFDIGVESIYGLSLIPSIDGIPYKTPYYLDGGHCRKSGFKWIYIRGNEIPIYYNNKSMATAGNISYSWWHYFRYMK